MKSILKYLLIPLLFLFLGIIPSQLSSQTIEDALRMSVREYITSARVLGTGSAMGAIGGDYGAVNINPANIGTFRNSYFTVSMGMNSVKTSSQWRESSVIDSDLNSSFMIPNIGFVTSAPLSGKWENINFGIGLNRVNSHTSIINTSASAHGSIVQRWAQLANEAGSPDNFDQFELLPAYESYALGESEDDEGNLTYFSDYGNDDILNKEVYEEVSGSTNEIGLTIGGNYDNKLLLGLNMGIPFYNNEVNYSYFESDSDPDNLYKSVLFEEEYQTSGLGFNIGFGAIFMPTYKFRLGLKFQSPTWYSLTENYSTRVKFDYYDPDNEFIPPDADTDYESEPGVFDYSFTSPWRIGAQAGWIIGKYGFIDIDVEYVNYADASFDLGQFLQSQQAQNSILSDALGSAFSINTGGEITIDEFRLRAGLGFQQDPYRNSDDFEPTYSGGLGFRGEQFYLDIGYRYTQREESFNPYLVSGDAYQPRINNTINYNNFILTVGFNL